MTLKKMKFAWKYRKPLWKYRKLISHRREIGVAAAAGLFLAGVGILTRRHRILQVDAQGG